MRSRCVRGLSVCGGRLALEKEEVASLFCSSRKTTGHRHRPDVYPVPGLEHGLHPHICRTGPRLGMQCALVYAWHLSTQEA